MTCYPGAHPHPKETNEFMLKTKVKYCCSSLPEYKPQIRSLCAGTQVVPCVGQGSRLAGRYVGSRGACAKTGIYPAFALFTSVCCMDWINYFYRFFFRFLLFCQLYLLCVVYLQATVKFSSFAHTPCVSSLHVFVAMPCMWVQ